MADAKARVKVTGDASGLDATLKQASGSMGAFKKLAVVGVASAVAVGFGKMGASAIRAAGDFQQGMANVGAISRASAQEMDALTASAKELGATTAFTAREAADGMSFLAMAGFDAQETIAAMPGTLALASAGAIDLASAADISSNVLSGFGLSANEADRAANVLAATASSANTNVLELGEGFKMAAPVAAALGVSMEETAAVMATLADGGIKATMAGTSVRQMLLSLSGPTPEAAGLLDSLGIQAFTAEGKLKPLPDVIGEVAKGVGGLNDQAKTEALGTIFGARNVGPVNLLLEKGADALSEYTDGITGTNAAADMAARQLDTFQGAMKLLQSAVSGAMIELGDAFLPILRLFVEAVTGAITAAQPFIEFFGKKIGEAIEQMRAALAPTAAVIGAMFSKLAPVFEAIAVVIGNNLIPIVIGLSVAIGVALIPVLGTAAGFLWGIITAAATAAAPFIALGAAVALAASLIMNNVGGVRDALSALWTGIVEGVQSIPSALSEATAGFIAAWEAIVAGAQAAVQFVLGAWSGFLEWLGGLRDAVVEWAVGLWEGAIAVFQSAVDLVAGAIEGIKTAISDGLAAALELARSIFEQFKPVFVVLGAAALVIVGPWVLAAMAGKAAFEALLGFLTGTVAPAVSAFVDAVKGFFEGMRSGTAATTTAMSSEVQASASDMSSTAGSTFQSFKDRAVEIWTNLRDGVVSLTTALKTKVVEIAQALADFLVAVWNWIKTNVIDRVVSLVQGIVRIFLAWFAWGVKFWTTVVRLIWSVWTTIGKTVARLVQKVAGVVADVLTKLGNWFGGYWDKFSGIVFDAWEAIAGVFRGALKAIWDTVASVFRGIVSTIGEAMGKAGGIVSQVFEAIQGFLAKAAGALGAFGGPLSAAASAMAGAIGGIKGKIAGLASSAVTGLKGVGGVVKDFFGGLVTKARNKFKGMFKGLKFDGAESLFEGVAPTIEGAAGDLGAGAGDALGQSLDDVVGGDSGGAGGGSKAKSKKAPKKTPSKKNAASAIANLAKKVAEAIQEGLKALEDLAGAEMPPREAWASKLEALTDFIQTATERFQEIALGTLTKIDVVDGVEQVSTAKADAVAATLKVLDNMFGTMAKAVQIAQGIAQTEFPEDTKVLDDLRDFLIALRDRAVEVADGIGVEAAEALGKVGAGIKVWVELFGSAIAAARELTAEGVDLGGLEGAAAKVEGFLGQIAAVGARFVAGLEAAVPDAAEQAEALALSERVAETFGAWIGVVARIGKAAADLAAIPKVPDIEAGLTRALGGIARAGGQFVAGLEAAYESTRDATKGLALSQAVAATFGTWFAALKGLVEIATGFRKLETVPEDVGTHIQRILSDLSLATWNVYQGLTTIPIEDALDGLALSGTVAQTFQAWIGAIKSLVDVVNGLREVGDTNVQAAFDHVVGFLDQIAQAGLPFVTALLSQARDEALGALGVSAAVAQTFGAWIAAIRDLAALIREAATTPVLEPGTLATILSNLETVRAAFEEQAVAWADAQIDAKETLGKVQAYASLVKTIADVLKTGTGIKVAEATEVTIQDLQVVLLNVFRLRTMVQGLAESWADAAGDFEQVVAESKAYQAVVAAAGAVFQTGKGLVLAEVTALSAAALDVVLDNVEMVRTAVQALAAKWAETVEDMAATNGIVDAYSKAVASTASVLSTASGIGLGEVTSLSADVMDVALDNASRVLTAVQALALAWTDTTEEAERLGTILEAWGKSVAGAVSALMSGQAAGIETATAVTDETIRLALDNADRVRAMAQRLATSWAENTEVAKDLGTRIAEWSKATGGAVDVLGKASVVFSAIQSSNVAGDITFQIEAIRDNIVRVLRALSDAFNQAEAEAGTLKRADDLAKVVSPAVEAIGKVIGTLSLDNLTKNPLFNLKAGSAFMQRTRANRLDHMAEQIKAGIRRVVTTIVDALADIDVPDNVESDFDRLATAFERIADIMARVREGIGDVDMGALKQFLEGAMLLAEGAAAIQGKLGAGVDLGGLTATELPGVVPIGAGPVPGVGPIQGAVPGGPIVSPFVPDPGGATRPVDPPDLNATVVNEVTVQIGEDVLARAIERTRAREAYVDTNAPTES